LPFHKSWLKVRSTSTGTAQIVKNPENNNKIGGSNNKQASNEKFVKNSCRSKRNRTTKPFLPINGQKLQKRQGKAGRSKFVALADAHLEFICLGGSA